jgi:hypothetical protein
MLDDLLRAQNPDGGWGAERKRVSATEATALAVLALAAAAEPSGRAAGERGLAWLVSRQNPDGGWPLNARVQDGSWTTAVAALALARREDRRDQALRGARWLLEHRGRGLGWVARVLYRVAPQAMPVRLDPDLRGWAWAQGSFSWVEPTSYALLALKRLRPHLSDAAVDERIHEAERMLYDRVCDGGGWNYGNTTVLGEALPPYPDTTALALIALQDHAGHQANRQSLQALRRMLGEVESGLTLAWSILCLGLYGEDPSEWMPALGRSYERTRFLGSTRALAVAVLASGGGREVFRL